MLVRRIACSHQAAWASQVCSISPGGSLLLDLSRGDSPLIEQIYPPTFRQAGNRFAAWQGGARAHASPQGFAPRHVCPPTRPAQKGPHPAPQGARDAPHPAHAPSPAHPTPPAPASAPQPQSQIPQAPDFPSLGGGSGGRAGGRKPGGPGPGPAAWARKRARVEGAELEKGDPIKRIRGSLRLKSKG